MSLWAANASSRPSVVNTTFKPCWFALFHRIRMRLNAKHLFDCIKLMYRLSASPSMLGMIWNYTSPHICAVQGFTPLTRILTKSGLPLHGRRIIPAIKAAQHVYPQVDRVEGASRILLAAKAVRTYTERRGQQILLKQRFANSIHDKVNEREGIVCLLLYSFNFKSGFQHFLNKLTRLV